MHMGEGSLLSISASLSSLAVAMIKNPYRLQKSVPIVPVHVCDDYNDVIKICGNAILLLA